MPAPPPPLWSVLFCCAAVLAASGCGRQGSSSPDRPLAAAKERRPSRGLLEGLPLTTESTEAAGPADSSWRTGIRLVDVHEEAGLEFVFDNGRSPQRLMVESTAGGAAWIDYDVDGWPDLYLPQGGNPFATDQTRRPSSDELFRNVGGRTFAAVSEHAGVRDQEFGHGAAAADFDNDGFDDLYVTNVGPDILYRNCGDGTFENVTRAAGIDSPLWGSSAAWADIDLDGNLDLYVCNYADYDPRNPISCLSANGEPGICHPNEVDGAPNKCFVSLGDGAFREVAGEWGLEGPVSESKSLGVVVADLNGDRLPDVFVANDTAANHLFVNVGNSRFEERAHELGCAMSGLGHYQASMGVGFGDYDENGFPDLYLTHFTEDSNTLYANHGPAGFEDVTRRVGLHMPTMPLLAFGTVMLDLDSNGRQDLFVANGHIDDWRERTGALWYMPAQLFSYDGSQWHDCGPAAGAYFEKHWLGRAVAVADYDRDGDADLAVVHQNDPMGLLRNESERGHWLNLRFIGRESNRRGIGVQVSVTQAGRRFVQQLPGGTSYCASHEPILFFGFGDSSVPCDLEVLWPSGRRQIRTGIAVDRFVILDEADAEAQ